MRGSYFALAIQTFYVTREGMSGGTGRPRACHFHTTVAELYELISEVSRQGQLSRPNHPVKFDNGNEQIPLGTP